MNCSEARTHLPAWLYGDLDDELRKAVQNHLQDCVPCRQESDSLGQVKELLGVVSAPSVQVDPHRIQQAALAKLERSAKRWRRATWAAVGGLAATLLLLMLPSLEVRWEGHQCVVCWGTPPSPPAPTPVPPAVPAESLAQLQKLQEQLNVLNELVTVIDRQREVDLGQVHNQLAALRVWVTQQMAENEKNLTAVYRLSRKGDTP